MLRYSQCFFKSAKGDLLSDHQEGRLICSQFEYLNDELTFSFFEFFEVLRKLNMREFEKFDGDR